MMKDMLLSFTIVIVFMLILYVSLYNDKPLEVKLLMVLAITALAMITINRFNILNSDSFIGEEHKLDVDYNVDDIISTIDENDYPNIKVVSTDSKDANVQSYDPITEMYNTSQTLTYDSNTYDNSYYVDNEIHGTNYLNNDSHAFDYDPTIFSSKTQSDYDSHKYMKLSEYTDMYNNSLNNKVEINPLKWNYGNKIYTTDGVKHIDTSNIGAFESLALTEFDKNAKIMRNIGGTNDNKSAYMQMIQQKRSVDSNVIQSKLNKNTHIKWFSDENANEQPWWEVDVLGQ